MVLINVCRHGQISGGLPCFQLSMMRSNANDQTPGPCVQFSSPRRLFSRASHRSSRGCSGGTLGVEEAARGVANAAAVRLVRVLLLLQVAVAIAVLHDAERRARLRLVHLVRTLSSHSVTASVQQIDENDNMHFLY